MSSLYKLVLVLFTIMFIEINVKAQEDAKTEIFSVNADFVSRYVWRGVDFGNAPAIQPSITATFNRFSIGTWGSYSLSSNTGGLEADLFASYSFDFGLQIGITDYYFPGERLAVITDTPDSVAELSSIRTGGYFNYNDNHLFELNLNYAVKKISISANYMFFGNKNDLYFELGYEVLPDVTMLVGGGNEAYSTSGNFNVTNAGLSVNKELNITDLFSLNVFGSLIVNPNTEQIHLIFGFGI